MRLPTLGASLFLVACSAEDLARISTPPSDPTSQESVREVSHTVAVQLDRQSARLIVTRQLRNDSEEFQTVSEVLATPEESVANAFRIGIDQRWQHGALLDAEQAADQWAELTNEGDAAPAPLGLLTWDSTASVGLELFGIAPGSSASVEYELQVPLSYAHGEWFFNYPAAQEEEAAISFELSRAPGATVEDLYQEESPELDSSFDGYRIHLPRPVFEQVAASWAIRPLGAGRTAWRLEVDAAAVLETAPVRPNVVFVIDASHSQGSEGIKAQLELLPAYLANSPDAQVELVLYRRFAERLFGRFIPASEAVRALASVSPERLLPGNGSNLELGARVAAQALAQVGGVGRILLFTDELLRESFSVGIATAELERAGPNTVTHLVAREQWEGELEQSRDDESELAPIATAAGGMFVRISGQPTEPQLDARTLLELIRPTRIDGFRVEALGMEEDSIDAPEVIEEGSSLRQTSIADSPPAQVLLTGRIWGREFRRRLEIDADLADRLPALVIGSDQLWPELTEEEVREAAMAARVVSPVTSFLSKGPAATPSWSDSASLSGSGSSGSHWTCGMGGVGTHCLGARGFATRYQNDLSELLAPKVGVCASQLGVDELHARVRVEVTGAEIVDVEVTGTPSAEAAFCLTEAIWTIPRTPFCLGENDRGWKANFDFLLQPTSFTKLLEGTYG